MIYTTEVQHMCPVAKGAYHGPAPIPEEGKWVQAKQLSDISGFTHGVGWCAPQQGACKLTLNVKDGVIEDGAFVGDGCAISQASADIMLGMIIGRKEDEARRLGDLFLRMIKGEATDEEIDDLEEASALRDVAHMPARVKCAVLGWHTLDEALKKEEQGA